MFEVYERLGTHCHETVDGIITLDHEQRTKGRLRVFTQDNEEVRIFLERGTRLQVGEYLRTRSGKIIKIEGAIETVAHASCEVWLTFSRACYHLGNRHVKLQLGKRWLRFSPDHVLEEMVHLLGLVVTHEQAVFEPESGAYNHSGLEHDSDHHKQEHQSHHDK